jgi:hypothetical protein
MSCHLGASWDEASATYNYQITEGRSLEWVSGTRLARDQLPGGRVGGCLGGAGWPG